MNFNDMVGTLIDVLDSQAKKIEEEKLKVINWSAYSHTGCWSEEPNRRRGGCAEKEGTGTQNAN